MLLALNVSGSHLSEQNSKSRVAGHYYLTNKDNVNIDNEAILTLSKIIKHVMGYACEAEVAFLFTTAK